MLTGPRQQRHSSLEYERSLFDIVMLSEESFEYVESGIALAHYRFGSCP